MIYDIFYGIILLLLFPLSLFSSKIFSGFYRRVGLLRRLQTIEWKRPYWFHVASSGELEQAIPLMEELKRREKATVLLTYFSPTAERAVELEKQRRGDSLPWDYSDVNPFDFSWMLSAFLKLVEPRALVLIHREVWPGMVRASKKENIPVFLFAAYLPEKGSRFLKWIPNTLKGIALIGATTESAARRLSEISQGTPVSVLGDPRIERVIQRLERRKSPPYGPFLKSDPIVLLASLWPEDLRALLPALRRLRTNKVRWRVLTVPHELEGRFIDKLQKELNRSTGENVRLWSHWIKSPDDRSHLIIDQVGILAELYQFAEIAFVGGSFRSRVHNILEPAAYGVPTLTGPYVWNSGEAIEMSTEGAGILVAKSAEELSSKLFSLCSDSTTRQNYSTKMREYLHSRIGAASRYVDALVMGVKVCEVKR